MFLEILAARRSDGYTCLFAASQRDRSDAGIGDQFSGFYSWDEHGAKDTLWETTLTENPLNLQSAPRDVRGMFQDHRIACHQNRGCGAKDLPERIIPGHQRQYYTKRQIRNIAVGGVSDDALIGKETCSVLSVIL